MTLEMTNYTYDTLGNLVLEKTKNEVVDYQYNNLNQLVRRAIKKDVTTYTYDQRGNRVAETGKKASRAFVYDATNHLVEGTNWKGDRSSYTYNGLFARVNNTYTYHSGQVYDRDFVPDYNGYGSGDVMAYNTALRNTQAWSPRGENVPTEGMSQERNDLMTFSSEYYTQKQVYTPWGERIEQFSDRTKQSGGNGGLVRMLYVHEDVVGNTRYYTKQTGYSFCELRYDVWGFPDLSGKLQNNDNGNFAAATFTGHIYDTILDVYWAEARFYDASNRTWMADDPVKDGLNWYQYAGSNPVTWFDPTGLFAEDSQMYPGAQGIDVWELQKALGQLNQQGVIDVPISAFESSGMQFGDTTAQAMASYHAMQGQENRNVVDADTWRQLGLTINGQQEFKNLRETATLGELYNYEGSIKDEVVDNYFQTLDCELARNANRYTANALDTAIADARQQGLPPELISQLYELKTYLKGDSESLNILGDYKVSLRYTYPDYYQQQGDDLRNAGALAYIGAMTGFSDQAIVSAISKFATVGAIGLTVASMEDNHAGANIANILSVSTGFSNTPKWTAISFAAGNVGIAFSTDSLDIPDLGVDIVITSEKEHYTLGFEFGQNGSIRDKNTINTGPYSPVGRANQLAALTIIQRNSQQEKIILTQGAGG